MILDFSQLAVEAIVQALKEGKRIEFPKNQPKEWEHKYVTQINIDSRETPLATKNVYYHEIAFNMVKELVETIKKDGHDVHKITAIEGSISLEIYPKIWSLELRTGFNFTYPTQWPNADKK